MVEKDRGRRNQGRRRARIALGYINLTESIHVQQEDHDARMTDPSPQAPVASSQDDEQPLTEPQPGPTFPSDGTPRHEDGSELRRYDRPHEVPSPITPLVEGEVVAFRDLEPVLAASALSEGGRALLRGLLQLGRTTVFPGGGAGIEYASLLKTAARPDHVGAHIREAAAYLIEREVDILVVPGMSGYPVGSMYAVVSGIPAVLLKKQKHTPSSASSSGSTRYPPGSFIIPSYTGEGDVVISVDLDAMQDIIDLIMLRQIAAQRDEPALALSVRVAGADDIIDKATMSQAVSESAMIVAKAAIGRFLDRYRAQSGDTREVAYEVKVVGWATPLIKGYNRPHEHLNRWFGISPFAGLNVTNVHLDPPAIGIDGVGIVGFATEDDIASPTWGPRGQMVWRRRTIT